MERQYDSAPLLILKGGQAFTPKGEAVDDLSAYFSQAAAGGAVMGFLRDDSEDEAAHEAAIGRIRSYTAKAGLPVMAGGHTRRLEDVKKYLYAGARAVFLRRDSEEEMAVREEAVRRFGESRVALYDSSRGRITVQKREPSLFFEHLQPGADGLVPCIVQDVHTGQVLMMAYMNEEAFQQTCETGRMTYYSRSRKSLWVKGETSGHFQYVRSLTADCDQDTLLAQVEQVGDACHTGSYSCFFQPVINDGVPGESRNVLKELEKVIAGRRLHPKEGSYTNYLFEKGIDKILKKVGEEATEIVIAAKNPDPEEIRYEVADFLYHVMVLLAEKGVAWSEVEEELSRR